MYIYVLTHIYLYNTWKYWVIFFKEFEDMTIGIAEGKNHKIQLPKDTDRDLYI